MPARTRLPDLFGRATGIFGEHAHLRETASRLRDLCAATGEQIALAEHELPRRIADLREELRAHFSAEESPAYFGVLESEKPDLASSIAELRAEHQIMLAELDELCALSAGDELLSRLKDVLERFHAHERSENTLLQDFFELG